MSDITIVMYHYVREIKNSEYPNLKGLEIEGFRRQLDYLQGHYQIITAEQLRDFASGGESPPENACLLTFDDGYRDHVEYVLPELLKRGIKGAFFPPVRAVVDGQLLDVNAIHFILERCRNIEGLVSELNELCLANGLSHEALTGYWSRYAVAGRYDAPETVYIKRMLQYGLPDIQRNAVIEALFTRHVGRDPSEFARALYCTLDDARRLVEAGMYVGGHGYSHLWLDKLPKESQTREIGQTLQFLDLINAPTQSWIMCYPYGAYNDDTLAVLKDNHCSIGLTTRVGAAKLDREHMLELSRFDTNDFPQ